MLLSNKFNVKKNLLIFLVLIILVAIIVNPALYIQSCFNGIIVWASVVLPALLPFMFFTKTLTELGVAEILSNKFKLFSKIYNVPAIALYVFVLSILSGYPVGSKIVSDLYERGLITKEQAYRITTFTSNSGPMFILGSVGIGMLTNKKLGIIILFSHIIGALLNGILYRNHKENLQINNSKINFTQNKQSLSDLMWNTVQSVLIIGGYIAIFFVLIEIINNLKIFTPLSLFISNIFNCNVEIINAIINGIFEITRGCKDLSVLQLNEFFVGVLTCFIISFGGIATTMQGLTFLSKFEMKTSFFIKQKITHAIFSTLVCALLLIIF